MNLSFEETCDFFEYSQCPNIFPYNAKGDVCLSKMDPMSLTSMGTIYAIQGVVKALVHLELNMLAPCQLHNDYIIRKNGVWGLRHAICHRTYRSNTGEDNYDLKDYAYHSSAYSYLVWNLGKISLRFFTTKEIDIQKITQDRIDNIIRECIEPYDIAKLIRRMLCCNNSNRISFQNIVGDKLMTQDYYIDSLAYSSMIQHIKKVSSFFMKSQEINSNTVNPFVIARKSKRFLEYLDIDSFLISIRELITSEFNLPYQITNCNIMCYIVTLQSYLKILDIDNYRLKIGRLITEKADRKYYSNFVRRIVSHKEWLDRERSLISIEKLPPELAKLFVDLSYIDYYVVYKKFKTAMKNCLDAVKSYLGKNEVYDLKTWKVIIRFLLARTSAYVFYSMRLEVFKYFLDGNSFDLKTILHNIDQCYHIEKIYKLYRTIYSIYFK